MDRKLIIDQKLIMDQKLIKVLKPGILSKEVEKLTGKAGDVKIICIGTDRATGDALGPLVGTFLQQKKCKFPVYGTLEDPVHAINVEETWQLVSGSGKVIVIDSSLSKERSRIGNLVVRNRGIKPGDALNKDIPVVGDISISGIVNIHCDDKTLNMKVLANTRLYIVWKMAEYIAAEMNRLSKRSCTQSCELDY